MSGELTPVGQGVGAPPSRLPAFPPGGGPAGGWTPPPPRTTPDDEIDLREVWAILRRNWWIVAGCTAVGLLAAFAYVKLATPIYRSSTTLQFQEKGSTVPVLDALRDLQGGTEVGTEMEVLRSRTLAEAVVDSLGLRLAVEKPGPGARSRLLAEVAVDARVDSAAYVLTRAGEGFEVRREGSDAVLATAVAGQPVALEGVGFRLADSALAEERIVLRVGRRQAVVEGVQENLGVSRPNRDAAVVNIRFDSPDPVLAAAVPNALAVKYLEGRNAVRKTGDRSTVEFLRTQLDTLAVQLRAAEDELRAFREQNQVVSLEAEASASVERLAELQAQRGEVEAERAALARLLERARDSWQEARTTSPYRALLAFPSLLRNQSTSTLLSTLSALETERSQLMIRRTPADPDVQALNERIWQVEGQIEALVTTYLGGLESQVRSLDQALAGFGERMEEVPAKEVQFARLSRNAQALTEIYTMLQSRLKEAEVLEAVEDASVRVVDGAVVGREPVKPRGAWSLALGLMTGGLVGIAGAFSKASAGHRINSEGDVEHATSLPVLVSVPRLQGRRRLARKSRESRLFGADGAGDHRVLAAAESIKALRSTLAFSSSGRAAKVLLVTSVGPEEGKSTIGLNLASALAQLNLRVLLIDGDLRQGVLHQELGLQGSPGLADWLQMLDADVPTVHPASGGIGELYLLPRGVPPLNPGELLGSDRMRGLVGRMAGDFDRIIIDSAPLGAVSDTLGVATMVDGAILVARVGKTRSEDLRRAAGSLAAMGVHLIGIVLNGVADSESSYSASESRKYLIGG